MPEDGETVSKILEKTLAGDSGKKQNDAAGKIGGRIRDSSIYKIENHQARRIELLPCGKLLTKKSATIDHVIPLTRGGFHCPNNAKIACKSCNSKKGDKTLSEYLNG